MTLRVHYKPPDHAKIVHRGASRHQLSYTDDVNLVTCRRCLQWLAASVERSMIVHLFNQQGRRGDSACGIKNVLYFEPPHRCTQNPRLVTCPECKTVARETSERIIQFALDHGLRV